MPNDPQLVRIERAGAPGVVFRVVIEFSDDWTSEDIEVTQSRALEFVNMEGASLRARFKGVLPGRKRGGCRGVVE